MNKNISTFIGCHSEYSDSDVVIFGAPYDGTASYRPGARFAPAAIRNEGYSIETYSPYLDRDLGDIDVFDGGDLELPYGNAESVLRIIEDYAGTVLSAGKIPFMIGGEHLTTLGMLRAVTRHYSGVCIVHFDAHADLRDDYLGDRLSHATVMRRCHELSGVRSIYQFGIRSGERAEFDFAKKHTVMHKFCIEEAAGLADVIADAPVYVTLDLDVLDPSEFCGTGTPEAGGVRFGDLRRVLRDVLRLNVVALDMCELSPPYDASGASTSLACKLLREMLLSLNIYPPPLCGGSASQ